MRRLIAKVWLYFYSQWHQYNEYKLGILKYLPCVHCSKKHWFRMVRCDCGGCFICKHCNGEAPCVCDTCTDINFSEAPLVEDDLLKIPVEDPN